MSSVNTTKARYSESIDVDLPSGWTLATLGELLPLSYGKALAEHARSTKGSVPVYGSSGEVGTHSEAIAPENSIIVGRKGAAGAVYFSLRESWPIDTAYYTTPNKWLEPRFWYYQLTFLNLRKLDQSTAIPSLSRDNYNPIQVGLPPLNEQTRIASKIDELMSRIEAGKTSLNRAKILVEHFRKSVLKAAVTGELTKDWREKNKDKIEPANKLLERILKSRRQAWEAAELAKLKAKGKVPKDDARKKRYTEPAAPDTTDLPRLPEGWVWVSLGQLSWATSYGTSLKCGYKANGVAVLRIPNVRGGTVNLEDLKFADGTLDIDNEDYLRSGDLLIVRTNGSPQIIGVGAVLTEDLPHDCYFASYLIRFRLANPSFTSHWVNLYFQTQDARDFVNAHAATSAGQYNISQSKLTNLLVPVASNNEMAEASRLANELIATADNGLVEILRQQHEIEKLRQSILKTAFEGKLVPQDPRDEPASTLLERIRSATAAPKQPKSRKGK